MNTGRQALRSQQLLFLSLITKRNEDEKIIVHHVIDTTYYLQLEIERRSKTHGIKFERIVL